MPRRTPGPAGWWRPGTLVLRRSVVAGVVGGEEVGTPVPAQVTPYGVDVVGAVLDVVVLQQERGRPDRVVVAGAPLERAGPGEGGRRQIRSGCALPGGAGEGRGEPVDVEAEQALGHPPGGRKQAGGGKRP